MVSTNKSDKHRDLCIYITNQLTKELNRKTGGLTHPKFLIDRNGVIYPAISRDLYNYIYIYVVRRLVCAKKKLDSLCPTNTWDATKNENNPQIERIHPLKPLKGAKLLKLLKAGSHLAMVL